MKAESSFAKWMVLMGLTALLTACVSPAPAPAPVASTGAAATAPAQVSTPTIAASPTPVPTPTLTPTPAPELRPLTNGGCCVLPAWSPDSRQVLFIDKPAGAAKAGIYAIDIAAGTSQPPQLIGRVGLYSPDRSLAAFAEGTQTIVEKISTGESWAMPNNGLSVDFAPDDRHLAWEQESINGPYDERLNDLYLANIDGTDAARVTRLYGGGIVGWMPQGLSLMFLGRPALTTHNSTLTVLDLRTNVAVDLATAERISDVTVSKDGTWVAYFISFDGDKTRNGLWVARTDGSQSLRLDVWSAYQWRDESHLLVVPMRDSADKAFVVWQFDAASGEGRPLTDAAVTPLDILNGDWRVSPDGQYMVYVNNVDRNLWLLKLPH